MSIGQDTLFFQDQDMNASLGVHEESDGYGTVLGQHSINTRNEKGVEALDLLQTHNLKAATTFHKHTKYNTQMNFCLPDWEYMDNEFDLLG